MVAKVEKAIRECGLGINPQLNGTIIMLPIPELNEQRRKELTKVAAQYAEHARVAIRNLRRDGMDQIKKAKAGSLSEDDAKFWEGEVQEMTDKYIKLVDHDAGNQAARNHAGLAQGTCMAAPQPAAAQRHAGHVAIIMDGNGRWATNRGWPRLVGHRKGAERVKEIVRIAPDLGIEWLTLYAFSTENWKRSTEEVLGLMAIFARYIQREADRLAAEGVRMRFIGDRSRLDPKLQRLMAGIEAKTAHLTRLNLTVAINYGGRDEILRAARALACDSAEGRFDPADLTEAAFSARLDTGGLPDPDLVIRTSGETRTSNFLPWQAAYAEYEFTETLWPDFSAGRTGRHPGALFQPRPPLRRGQRHEPADPGTAGPICARASSRRSSWWLSAGRRSGRAGCLCGAGRGG